MVTMEGSIKYMESNHMHSTKFMRNSKAVGVLWGIFSVCYSIITIVVFMQDQWIVDGSLSKISGNFGLWRWCVDSHVGRDKCRGEIADFSTFISTAFTAATIFAGLGVVAAWAALFFLVLFIKFRSCHVYRVCGILQVLSGVCLSTATLCYPSGLGSESVQEVCGENAAPYSLGSCAVGWAYILAIIACCDAIILGCLALTLSTKQEIIVEEDTSYGHHKNIFHGEINPGFVGDTYSIYGSRNSINNKAGVIMGHGKEEDGYSIYSHITGRSHISPFRGTFQQNLML